MTTRNEHYDTAVTSPSNQLLVIAPPGCGKTELLARRALHLLPTLEPHQRILALTFSNKARANLASRLRATLGRERMQRYVTVRNFHGHAAELIRSHGATLGLDPQFQPPERSTLPRAMAPWTDPLPKAQAAELTVQIESELRMSKQCPRTDAQVMNWLRDNACQPAIQIELDRQVSGEIYYDDLLRHAQRLLRVPQVSALYRLHYGAVLVDEFQDLSPQQLDLALRSCDADRTFVGDPLQGIYTWTGARPVQVERRLRRLCGKPNGLGVSYRSSPRVLDVVNVVASSLGGQPLQADQENAWFEGGIVGAGAFSTGAQEATFVVDTAAAILQGRPDSTIGVISRMGWRRIPVDEAFATTTLPVTHWDRYVEDPAILRLLVAARERLGSKDITSEDFCREVLAGIDTADEDSRAEIAAAIDTLAEQVNDDDPAAFRAVLDGLRSLDADAPIAAGVHLLNAHVGKGQQFDWVFIPGFEQGHVPSFLAKGTAEQVEEKRILLVMLSRARHGVMVTRAGTLISAGTGKPYTRDASPWASMIQEVSPSSLQEVRDHIRRYDGTQT